MTQATVAVPPAVRTRATEQRTPPKLRGDWLPHAGSAAVLVNAGWWAIAVAREWGGRGPVVVSIGLLLTAAAVVATRPDRIVGRGLLALATGVSGAAFAVAATAPTGWRGAPAAATYAGVSWTLVATAAAVRRDHRVADLAVLTIVSASAIEVAEAWLPWWGGRNPTAPMSGTFYWYNPFAAFLVPGALLGLWWWLHGDPGRRVLGLFAGTLAAVGIVYSTSRATAVCWLVGLLGILAVYPWTGASGKRWRLPTGVAVTGVGVALVAGPPFFPHWVGPFAGTHARAVTQSLGQNGGYRLDFWREAVHVFQRWPVTGGGYHSLATASAGHVPAGWPLSPLAHNGYLQALCDGGLVLGVPFLAGAVIVGWIALRMIVRSVRRRDFGLLSFAVPLCLLAMLAHSVVDFDWSYPADFLLTALLAGVVVGCAESRAGRHQRPRSWPSIAAVVVAVPLLLLGAWAARHGDSGRSLPITASAGAAR